LRAPTRSIELPDLKEGRISGEKARQLQSPAAGVRQPEHAGCHEVGEKVLDVAAKPRSVLHRAWKPGQRSNQRHAAPSANSDQGLRDHIQPHETLLGAVTQGCFGPAAYGGT